MPYLLHLPALSEEKVKAGDTLLSKYRVDWPTFSHVSATFSFSDILSRIKSPAPDFPIARDPQRPNEDTVPH